jgi:hypothetical protein
MRLKNYGREIAERIIKAVRRLVRTCDRRIRLVVPLVCREGPCTYAVHDNVACRLGTRVEPDCCWIHSPVSWVNHIEDNPSRRR